MQIYGIVKPDKKGEYDMKKITCMLLVGLLIFALCACSQNNQSAMYIKPSVFFG